MSNSIQEGIAATRKRLVEFAETIKNRVENVIAAANNTITQLRTRRDDLEGIVNSKKKTIEEYQDELKRNRTNNEEHITQLEKDSQERKAALEQLVEVNNLISQTERAISQLGADILLDEKRDFPKAAVNMDEAKEN